MQTHPLIRALALALGATVALGFARFAYGLLLPAMKQDLSWSYTQAGGMNTANALGYLAGSIFAAYVMKWFGLRKTFLGSLVLTGFALLACGFTTNYSLLFLLRLLAGLTGALVFISGASLTTLLANQKSEQAALIISLYFSGAGLGIALSGAGIPWLIGESTAAWSYAWMVLGGGALLFTLLTTPFTGGLETSSTNQQQKLEPWSLRPLLAALTAYSLFALGYISYMTFSVALLRSSRFSDAWVSLFWVVLGMSVIVGSVLWRKLIQSRRDGRALAALLLVVSVGAVLPVISLHPVLVLLSAFLFGCAFMHVVSAITALVRVFVPASGAPLALSLFTVAFAVGQALGPLIAGLIADNAGLSTGLALSAVTLFVGSVVAWFQPSPR